MDFPNEEERRRIYDQVKQLAKSKGKGIQDNREQYLQSVIDKSGPFKESIKNCMQSQKAIISEIVKWVKYQNINSETSLKWFKAFLSYILKCVKVGIGLVKETIKYFAHGVTVNLTMFTAAQIAGSIVFGIIGCVVIFGVALWYKAIETVSGTSTNVKDITIPKPKVPNVKLSMFKSNKMNESVEIIGGAIFVLFFQAAVAASFNEDFKKKNKILKDALSLGPTLALFGFLATALAVGSAGLAIL